MILDKIVPIIKQELQNEPRNYGEKVFLSIKVDIDNVSFIEVECTPYGECEDPSEILTQEELNHTCISEDRYITEFTGVDCHCIDLYDKKGDYINSLKQILF